MDEKNFIGIDYHKKSTTMTVVNASGEIKKQVKVLSNKESIQNFIRKIDGPKEAVMEATRSWSKIYDIIDEEVDKMVLAHPLKVKAIASAKIKNDKIDSEVLAHLLRANLIPESYVPCKETRLKKCVIRLHMFLTMVSTMIKNRIHDLIDRNHISIEALGENTNLFCKTGIKILRALELKDSSEKVILNLELDLFEETIKKLKETDKYIEELAKDDENVKYLKSIPGIGKFLSVLISYEIDKIDRFDEPKKLWSYAGIIPSLYSSGEKTYMGKITKQGNKFLRWGLIEAVYPAINASGSLREYYYSVKKNKGSNPAKVATARKILKLVWHLLKEKRYYEERINKHVCLKVA